MENPVRTTHPKVNVPRHVVELVVLVILDVQLRNLRSRAVSKVAQ